MGEIASFWGYKHDHMDELGKKLLWTTLELESLKSEAEEEMRKNKVYVKKLINLLNHAIQERDEARSQLLNLINKTMLSSTDTENSSADLSHESTFDAVSSPEFLDNYPFSVQDVKNIDQGLTIIDSISKGRALPRKGKFLQAVLEAGLLLETLLVAGPLPTLQNPPTVQPFQIPLVLPKRLDGATSVGRLGSQCARMTCEMSRISSNMSNFSHFSGISCLSNSSTFVHWLRGKDFVEMRRQF